MNRTVKLMDFELERAAGWLQSEFNRRRRGKGHTVEYEGPDYTSGAHFSDFWKCVETHFPDFSSTEILDAAFAAFANPEPNDLWGEEALGRTRTYWASRKRDVGDKVQADIDDVERRLRENLDWLAKLGELHFIAGTYPLLAYAFALETNLRGLDVDFFRRIERDAVLYNKLHPGYVNRLRAYVADFEVIDFDWLVEALEAATAWPGAEAQNEEADDEDDEDDA